MRDLALLTILLSFCAFALYRPWLGVLGLAVLGFMHPQGYATGFMREVPPYLTLFGVTSIALIAHFFWRRPRIALHWDWRLAGIALLWAWFAYTTSNAIAPSLAWTKFDLVIRILPPLVLLLLLIDTREKFDALLAIIALSICLVAFKGGYWALMTGFQDRVYGPPGSQYHDNNEFTVAIAMAIPLLMVWLATIRDRGPRLAILAGIVVCYGAALSSWSRGGLLALAVATLPLILLSRRKRLAIPFALAVFAAFATQLPDEWFNRMENAGNYPSDQSATNRLAVWEVGIDYTLRHHPVRGSGFESWQVLTDIKGGDIDWHNVYVKIAAEHGLVGLALWLSLLLGTLLRLTWLYRKAKRGGQHWLRLRGAMLGASLAAYLVGGMTLGIAYWALPFWLVVLSVRLEWIARQSKPVSRTSDGGPASLSMNLTHSGEQATQQAVSPH